MSDNLDGKCGTCKWWVRRFHGRTVDSFDVGQCRRYGPMAALVVTLYNNDSHLPAFPQMQADQFCGDYLRQEPSDER